MQFFIVVFGYADILITIIISIIIATSISNSNFISTLTNSNRSIDTPLLLPLTLTLEIQLFLKHISQLPGLMSVVRVASTLGVQGIEMGMAHRCVLAYSAVDLWEVGIVLFLPLFTHTDHTDPAS